MQLSRVERNVLANFLARIWAGLISILLIPVYIKYVGVEAYGLVGVFVSLQTLLLLLDLGLGATANREFGRFGKQPDKANYLRDMLRTLELFYWGMAVLVAALVLSLSGQIAGNWLSTENLATGTVTSAVVLIGLTIAVQWPASLYSGGLSGLQHQVRLSALVSGFATIRYGGAIAVLHFVSPTIEAFFVWQLFVGVIQTPVFRYQLMTVCPQGSRAGKSNIRTLVPLWRFASGMLAITALSTVVTQLDKILLSRALSLEIFGYYSVATAAAGSVYMAVGPVFNAFYPRFAALFEDRDSTEICASFHQGNQILSVILFPILWLVVFYAEDIMLLWTGDPQLAGKVALFLVPLLAGNVINGLMNVPYAAQLGAGRTRIPLATNLIGLVFMLPAMIYGIERIGALGAALAWLLFNIVYLVVTALVMPSLIERGPTARWLLRDIGLPLAASMAIVGGSFLLLTRPLSLLELALLTALAFLGTIASAPGVRSIFIRFSQRLNPPGQRHNVGS